MMGRLYRHGEPEPADAELLSGHDILDWLGPHVGRAVPPPAPRLPARPDYGPRSFTLPQLLAARRLAARARHPWSGPRIAVVESGLAVRITPPFASPWRESICTLGENDTLPEDLLRYLVAIAEENSYRDERPHLDEAGHIRGVAGLDPAMALLWCAASDPTTSVRTTWAVGRDEATLVVYEPGHSGQPRGGGATVGRALRCVTPLAGSPEQLARGSRALPTARYGLPTVAALIGLLVALHGEAVALRVALPLAVGAERE